MAAASSLPPTLVCLDFDGCLVDSRGAITTAISHTLRARGLAPPPQEDLECCIGPPLIECFGRLLAGDGADIEEARRLVEDYREVYPALAAELTTVVDGTPRALEALSADVTLAVVTSKPGAYTRPLLDALDLGRFVSATFAPALTALDEAKATTLSRALAWFAPQAAIMVGDRWHDIIAGRACGAHTIGVTWGIGSAGELRDAGADVLIDDPGDLAETVVSLRRRARRS